ncbi:hypothetical protein V2J09_009020 [Rumex salicifolius]
MAPKLEISTFVSHRPRPQLVSHRRSAQLHLPLTTTPPSRCDWLSSLIVSVSDWKKLNLVRPKPSCGLEQALQSLQGAPNAGKSSLVHDVSTGKPEVTDTPGLLTRHDGKRTACLADFTIEM